MNTSADLQPNRPPKRLLLTENYSAKTESRGLNRSSSESDVSTTTSSTENLTCEERFVLRHMRRQDPQGQEKETFLSADRANMGRTATTPVSGQQAINSLDAASSCATVVIHDSLTEDTWPRLPGIGSIQDLNGPPSHFTSTPNKYRSPAESRLYSNPCLANLSVNSTRSLPRSAKDFTALGYFGTAKRNLGSMTCLNKPTLKNADASQQNEQMKILEKLAREMNLTLPHGSQIYDSFPASASSSFSQVSDQSDASMWSRLSISDTLFADESALNKNQDSETNPAGYAKDFSYLSKPPPAYPRRLSNASKDSTGTLEGSKNSSRRTRVRRALSRSHPDLSKLGKDLGIHGTDRSSLWKGLRERRDSKSSLMDDGKSPESRNESLHVELEDVPAASSPATAETSGAKPPGESENEKAVWTTPELVDAILEENFELRKKVQNHAENLLKLQRFEEELSAVHKTHEAVIRSCERREQLERSVRIRLEAEVRRLQEINLQLRNQVDVLSSQLSLKNAVSVSSNSEPQNALHKEIVRRDGIIAQLVSQNNELNMTKERQDLELSAQRATLQEQRSHIGVLESALNNAQLHISRLEEQCRKKVSAENIQKCVDYGRYPSSSIETSNSNYESIVQANKREISNLQTRIRDLEMKLAEKDTIVRVLQRSSMDRETSASTSTAPVARLPEPVSLINRFPQQQTTAFTGQGPILPPYEFNAALQQYTESIYSKVPNTRYCSSPASSLPGSARGSAASVASSSGGSAAAPTAAGGQVFNNNNVQGRSNQPPAYNGNSETIQMLDEQIRVLDRALQPKQSLIQALRSDRERFPNYYLPS